MNRTDNPRRLRPILSSEAPKARTEAGHRDLGCGGRIKLTSKVPINVAAMTDPDNQDF